MKKIIFLTVLAFSLSTPKYFTYAKPRVLSLGESIKIKDNLSITFNSVKVAPSCFSLGIKHGMAAVKKGYKCVVIGVEAKNMAIREAIFERTAPAYQEYEIEVDKGYFYSSKHPGRALKFRLLPEETGEDYLMFHVLKTTRPVRLHGRISTRLHGQDIKVEFVLPLDKITYSPAASKGTPTVSSRPPATTIASLPYSWIEDPIMITIHGVFHTDSNTKEGWVSEKDEQYKVLISYKNTSAKPYQSKYSLFEPSPGVGYLRLKTDSGNLYGPKYGGGAIVITPLAPKDHYTTHNYAFNIHMGEKPIMLCKYKDRKAEQPIIIFNLATLIPPPIPNTMRIIKMRELLKTADFAFQPISVNTTKYVITGPYKGRRYALHKPKTGYKFVYLKLRVTNVGMECKGAPLYTRDGEFKVKVDRGYIYKDFAPTAAFFPGSKNWAREATETDRSQYPTLVNYVYRLCPEEKIELVKAIEILKDTEPTEFTFRLLGQIDTVKIKLNDT